MHKFREKLKMAEGERGQLLGKRAMELAKIAWAITYMHLPMKQVLKWMHGYGENAKMVEGDGG